MEKRLFNINQLSEYTGLSKNTLYCWVCQKRIPHYKIQGRLLRFNKEEIDVWIDSQKVEQENYEEKILKVLDK